MNNELEWEVITDSERLFHLHKAGWEIEVKGFSEWIHWDGVIWQSSWSFRARQPKPKMKQVKLLAYLGNTSLQYVREDSPFYQGINWTRPPNLDLIAEVQE